MHEAATDGGKEEKGNDGTEAPRRNGQVIWGEISIRRRGSLKSPPYLFSGNFLKKKNKREKSGTCFPKLAGNSGWMFVGKVFLKSKVSPEKTGPSLPIPLISKREIFFLLFFEREEEKGNERPMETKVESEKRSGRP